MGDSRQVGDNDTAEDFAIVAASGGVSRAFAGDSVIDLKLLRHPLERTLFTTYAVLNVIIMSTAVAIALQGADWISAHPMPAKYHTEIRAIAVAAVLGPVVVTFFRRTRWAQMSGNSVMLSSRQLPQIDEMFRCRCRELGLEPPELYFSDALKEPARSFTAANKAYVVLGTEFLEPDVKKMLPVLAFLLGCELGRLHLGHASWPTDLLLTYTRQIPYLKNPLARVFVYSEDRWGACFAPDAVIGLVALATGRLMLPTVNIEEYLHHVHSHGGIWAFLAEFVDGTPSVACRINALMAANLVQRTSDGPLATADSARTNHPGANRTSLKSASLSGSISEEHPPKSDKRVQINYRSRLSR